MTTLERERSFEAFPFDEHCETETNEFLTSLIAPLARLEVGHQFAEHEPQEGMPTAEAHDCVIDFVHLSSDDEILELIKKRDQGCVNLTSGCDKSRPEISSLEILVVEYNSLVPLPAMVSAR